MQNTHNLRNIAIIAHVDHGKTSIVNEMLKQGGVFRDNQVVGDRIMDSNDLEKERGITILSKNASFVYKGTKINVVDTPGHADFGGEVERVLKMIEGVLLVVDAYEGPMPQTRFVLEKALELNLKVIIVVNKVDRKDARLSEVVDEVLELLMDLNATDEQLDSPVIYTSARAGVSSDNPEVLGENFEPLFDAVLKYIPAPKQEIEKPLRMLVSAQEHNDFFGKIVIGKIEEGQIKVGDNVLISNYFDESKNVYAKIQSLFEFSGMKREQIQFAQAGDIISISGIEAATIGDTISARDLKQPLPFVKISEPSIEMQFLVNNSPFAGKEGKFSTSRHLKERLIKEATKDLSLKVFETQSPEAFRVLGRGEMHISILIENMRRDGYEFQVSMPKVIFKEVEGKKFEPIEKVVIDVPEESVGNIMMAMGNRKGNLTSMNPNKDRMRLIFEIPARGLFGYKSQFLTDTKGNGIMNNVFLRYEEFKGSITRRNHGMLVAFEDGQAVQYGLFNSQQRGRLLINAGEKVYAGMIVGINPKNEDVAVNVCKQKKLTNMRASGSDESLSLEPVKKLSLEQCIEILDADELLEVTPENLRLRKTILDHTQRQRQAFKIKNS
jgi:GTP-binding protein